MVCHLIIHRIGKIDVENFGFVGNGPISIMQEHGSGGHENGGEKGG